MTLTTEQVKHIAKTIAEHYRNKSAELANLVKTHLRFDMANLTTWPNDIDTASYHLTVWYNHPEFIAAFLRAFKEICPEIKAIDELIEQATSVQHEEQGGRLEVMLADSTEDLPETYKFLENVAVISRQICRITAPNHRSRDGLCTGTGFLVGPDLVLTNYHVLEDVINDKSLTGQVVFEFDYGDKSKQPPKIHMAATDPLLDWSPYAQAEGNSIPLDAQLPPNPNELDYALVRLERAIGTESDGSTPPRRWIKIPAPSSFPLIRQQMYLLIMQHPEGKSLRHDEALSAVDKLQGYALIHKGLRVRYKVNTQGGSSGSPCFDIHYNLVALHHSGSLKGETPDFIKFNQGIPIDKIRDRLEYTIQWTQPDPDDFKNSRASIKTIDPTIPHTTKVGNSMNNPVNRRKLIVDLQSLTETDLGDFIQQYYGRRHVPAMNHDTKHKVNKLVEWAESIRGDGLEQLDSDFRNYLDIDSLVHDHNEPTTKPNPATATAQHESIWIVSDWDTLCEIQNRIVSFEYESSRRTHLIKILGDKIRSGSFARMIATPGAHDFNVSMVSELKQIDDKPLLKRHLIELRKLCLNSNDQAWLDLKINTL